MDKKCHHFWSKIVTTFGPKWVPLWLQNGVNFGSKMGTTLDPKWEPLWVQNGDHFGPKMGTTLGLQWIPPHFPEHSKMRTLGVPIGAFFLTDFGHTFGPKLAPLWVQNWHHFGSKMRTTWAPK